MPRFSIADRALYMAKTQDGIQSGRTIEEIAAELGVRSSTIRSWARELHRINEGKREAEQRARQEFEQEAEKQRCEQEDLFDRITKPLSLRFKVAKFLRRLARFLKGA